MSGLRSRAFALACALALPAAVALPAVCAADAPTPPPYVPPPYVAVTPDPNIPTYDDASVHFAAPVGWKKVVLPPDPENPSTPVVAFVEPAKYDAASIGIAIDPDYSQTLQRLDIDHEQEIRQSEGFIDHSSLEKLSNGMPAYFVISNAGDGTGGTRRYEWLVIDGKRSITVTEVARRGILDEATARKTLSTLTVVVYPRGGN